MNCDFRKRMQDLINTLAASPKSPAVSEEKYNAICSHLLDKTRKVDPHFKHWVKIRQFQLVDIPELGMENVLVLPNNQKSQLKYLTVVHSGNVYDVVEGIHAYKLNHSGYKKVMEYVQRYYYGITRGFVQEYCKQCPVCEVSHSQLPKPPVRPAFQQDFRNKMQIEIIDMENSPNNDYKYIGHFMDLISNFHVLFPLKQRSKAEVAAMLEERVLAYIGLPKDMMGSDKTDFIDDLISSMLQSIQNDSLDNKDQPLPFRQSAETANIAVKQKIEAIKQEENLDDESECPWVSWLPRIMYDLNHSWHRTIQYALYHEICAGVLPIDFGADEPIEVGIPDERLYGLKDVSENSRNTQKFVVQIDSHDIIENDDERAIVSHLAPPCPTKNLSEVPNRSSVDRIVKELMRKPAWPTGSISGGDTQKHVDRRANESEPISDPTKVSTREGNCLALKGLGKRSRDKSPIIVNKRKRSIARKRLTVTQDNSSPNPAGTSAELLQEGQLRTVTDWPDGVTTT